MNNRVAGPHEHYESPLTARYASAAMSRVFSPQFKFSTWRRLWVVLAAAQAELGVSGVTPEKVAQLERFVDDINFDSAREWEHKLRHDVMAHVRAFGEQAPAAAGIIHLGATSAFVADNTDLIQIREAYRIIQHGLTGVIDALAAFARARRDLATLGFTHYQPAQPTTVGKRACLWLNDLLMDFEELEHRQATLAFRGVKGTTGTQASFLQLLGSGEKVDRLERRVAEQMGFTRIAPVTGQTYSRKIDSQALKALSGVCESAVKFATDIRLLANHKEIEEPFETEQVGSSAMAYKRNPMRCERICALGRYVITLTTAPAMTAATQWLERTLDDSAGKRLYIPEGFLATDAVLILMQNVSSGLVVYPEMIRRNLELELPFMATEEILLAAVEAGGDRQALHERIRVHSQEAAAGVKQQGRDNDLLERIAADEAFAAVKDRLNGLTDPARFIGRAPEQVDRFLQEHVQPLLDRRQEKREPPSEPRV